MLVIAMVVFAVVGYSVYTEKAKLVDRAKKNIDDYFADLTNEELRLVAEAIQDKLYCCGADDFTSWKNAQALFPKSCCVNKSDPACRYKPELEGNPGNAANAQYRMVSVSI